MPAFDSIAVNAALTTNLSVASVMSVTGSLGVTGATTLASVTVPGAATLGSASVTTLGVSGTSTLGAVTVNGALSGQNGDLNVTGNVVVSGDIIAQGNVIYQGGPAPIQYQNLADRTAMDTTQIYGYKDSTANVDVQYYIKPIVATTSLVLRDANGPTSMLTSSTSHNNPIATTRYGQPAPLVKINDNGSYQHIDVANNSISNICTIMMPTSSTANTFKIELGINNQAADLVFSAPILGQSYASYSNIIDAYTDLISTYVKYGFPLPPPNGCSTYNTRNIYFQSTQVGDYPTTSGYAPLPPNVGPVQVAVDVNPYLNGFGTMNLYFCGGFQLILPIDLPGQNFGVQTKVPAFPIAVTTSGAEYQYKVSINENVCYLNTDLNVVNISITNFGTYKTTMLDASNVFGSNVLTSSPQTFKGSFGFFRTSSKVTTTASGIEVPDSNVVMSIVSGGAPVTASPTTSEYMIQVGSPITFTYNLSNATATNTYTTTILNTYGGLADYWTLAQYDGGNSNVNMYHQSFDAEENTGMPLTNTSSFGKNDFYPFLNTNKGKSAQSFAAMVDGMYYFNNVEVEPESMSILPNGSAIKKPEYMCIGNFQHEFQHGCNYSIGLENKDSGMSILDDELITSIVWYGLINKQMTKTPGCYRTNIISAQTEVYLHASLRSGAGMLNTVNFEYMANALAGTNFNVHGLVGVALTGYANASSMSATTFSKYYSATVLNCAAQKYDPNFQFYKTILFDAAAKVATIPTNILNAIDYQNDARTYAKSLNPSIANKSLVSALSNINMYYSSTDGGARVSDAMQLLDDEIISSTIARNNGAIPDKFKHPYPIWYKSGYNSNTTFVSSAFDASAKKMFAWDFLQTNDDPVGGNGRYEFESVIPWWPKNITGLYSGNVNSVGRVWYDPITGLPQAQTQDTTYRAMSNVSLLTYTSNVVRNLYPTASIMYALPPKSAVSALSGVSNVTVTLQEPTIGTYAGGYNTNVSVSVFKYIPDRCVSNVLSNAYAQPTANTGAFMMAGPYFLNGTGSTKTIDLTAVVTDGTNGFTFKTNSTNLVNGTRAFSNVYSFGIDDGTMYIPPTWANAYATDLGMTASSGVYQPVTYLLITNRNIDSVNWSDADIQQKLFASQIKPTCVKIGVNSLP